VLIYDRALTAGERIQVEEFLQVKYITGNSTPNDPPVAQDDSFVFVEDTPLAGDVLADNGVGVDNDPNGDSLSVSLVTGPAQGTLVLNTDGSFSYTPVLNWNGVDSFIYRLSDSQGGDDTATVTLTGTPVDDPAVAVNDSYAVGADTQLVVGTATGVLANDSDPEGDAFTASLVSTVAHGALTLNPDGSFSYTPDAGYQGGDSFTYQITGGATAAVSLQVGGQEVPITAGLVAAYRSDENVSLGAGNQVSGWLDGSGRGNDLVALGNPQLVANQTPTGQAAIVFDGTGDLLQRVNATDTLNGLVGGGGDRTMFFVVDYIAAEGVTSGLVYGDGARNEAFGLAVKHADGDLMVHGWGSANDFDSNDEGLAQGWLVQSVVLDDNLFQHYLNGTLIDSRTKAFNTDLQKLIIGAEIAGLGESQMNVAAAFIYDRALSVGERQDMETYLQHVYIDEGFLIG
jgi:VCBS repeat-containing protein